MIASLFVDTFERKPVGQSKITSILYAIKKGRWKKVIEDLRADKSNYTLNKSKLHAVTFSGIFHPDRRISNLDCYSFFIVIDFDKINPYEIKEQICKDKYTYACFVSPGGEGLKVLVRVDSEREDHKKAFSSLVRYYKANHRLSPDESGKDVSRLCYISYDPDLYLNPDSETYSPGEEMAPEVFSKIRQERNFDNYVQLIDTEKIFLEVKRRLEIKVNYVEGNRNNYLFQLSCRLSEAGVTIEETKELIEKNFTLPEEGCKGVVRSAYLRTRETYGTREIFVKKRRKQKVITVAAPIQLKLTGITTMKHTGEISWGAHKNKQMVQIPAEYLLYLHHVVCEPRVYNYVEDNLEIIKHRYEKENGKPWVPPEEPLSVGTIKAPDPSAKEEILKKRREAADGDLNLSEAELS